MNFATGLRWSFALLLATLLISCAKPKTQNVWQAEGYSQPLEKVMVIAVSHQELRRKMVENVFRTELGARGVQVLPSYEYFPELGEFLTRGMILAKAREIGAESILVARAVSVEELENYQPSRASYGWVYAEGEDFTFYGRGFMPSVKKYDSEMYTIASYLYHTEQEKRVWTSLSEVWVKGSPESMVRPYIALVLQQLRESKLTR